MKFTTKQGKTIAVPARHAEQFASDLATYLRTPRTKITTPAEAKMLLRAIRNQK